MATSAPLFPGNGKKDFLGLRRARGEDRQAMEARLRILVKAVEQSPVSIIVTDNQGIIEYVNPKFCQVTGYSAEEVLGKTPRILKGGFLTDDFYRDLWRTILAGRGVARRVPQPHQERRPGVGAGLHLPDPGR